MNRSSKALKSVIFGFLFKILSMVGPFVVRIIVNWTLGVEYLGVSGVFSSVLSMLSLAELGFASAITYKCYSLYAENDKVKLHAYLNFYKNVYRIIGMIIIVLGVAVTPFLKEVVSGEIPQELNIYVVYYILLFNTAISYFLAAYRIIILIVTQRQDIESKIAIICNLLMYILQIVILLFIKNYYIYLAMLPLCTIMINIVRYGITKKKYPDLIPKGNITLEEKREIVDGIKPLIGHRLQGTIVVSADNIVISIFMGITMVAIYNNYYTIIAALSGFIIAIYAAIQPGIGNSMVTETVKKNYEDFNKLSFVLIWIIGWMSISSVCLFQDFISFTYGEKYLLPCTTVFLLVFEFYIWKTFDIVMTYRDVVGKWSGDGMIPYISGGFNLITNVVLVKLLGVNGVIISTILAFTLFTIPNSLKVLLKDVFNVSIYDYLGKYVRDTLIIFLVGILTYFICKNINTNSSIINFICKGVICIVIPNILLFMIWRKRKEYIFFKDKLIGKFIN